MNKKIIRQEQIQSLDKGPKNSASEAKAVGMPEAHGNVRTPQAC
jgi:hypothetical protein